MKPKIIKTERDYEAALSRIEELMDAGQGTSRGDELDLLSTLVHAYEDKVFPVDLPDPVEAVRFRMEQQGLKPRDLVAYIGSRSRVSEVLSGRRNLSLNMIRALSSGLNIPAAVLVRDPATGSGGQNTSMKWERYPLAEMLKRNWFAGFQGTLSQARRRKERLLTAFAGTLGLESLQPALLRQHIRAGGNMDVYSLAVWQTRIARLADDQNLSDYRSGTTTLDFMKEVVSLSYFDKGPKLAEEFLKKHGIHFVVERHLPRTHLDGAALLLPDGSPVVALTLRYDRLDNFWFTLSHELAHISLHLDNGEKGTFVDDLSVQQKDRLEREADDMACEALIPKKKWKASGLSRSYSALAIQRFAKKRRISPAIPAGRIRREKADYRILSGLIGNGDVRCLFLDANS